ncbi:DUF2971 domain-containing protein [Marinobacterium sedimentorum]|uniref:DUF2971 domain-containing protein n=1 Tax=Marinobacterium sedimentorum TaxID=2927804 RepID=UPI0020C6C5E7|nr:DUF2971 domain-containing protein [Marinobacterium sedimentorum]MCP8687756.1 DUF2971 domain-containing protein [Marinobacterium sedimentorum]
MENRFTLEDYNANFDPFIGDERRPKKLVDFENEVRSAFLSFRNELREEDFSYVPTTLWHYTTTDSFFEILKTNSIFLSDSDYLNDPNEGLKLCEDLLAIGENLKNKSFSKLVKSYVDNRILLSLGKTIGDRTTSGIHNCYLASFSATSTSLDQWRLYGDDARGVCIGFEGKALIERLCDRNKLHLHKIRYKTIDRNKIVQRIYDMYSDFIGKTDVFCSNDKSPACFEALNFIKSQFLNFISDIRYSIKHKAYKNEDEWRVRLRNGADFVQEDMQYLSKRNAVTEVYKLSGKSYHDHKLPIRKIVCGPLHNEHLTKRFVASLEDVYGKLIVTKSRLPYRGR